MLVLIIVPILVLVLMLGGARLIFWLNCVFPIDFYTINSIMKGVRNNLVGGYVMNSVKILSEKWRSWSNTTEGKKVQCGVFAELVKKVEVAVEDGETIYVNILTDRLANTCVSNGLDKGHVYTAISRLREHGLVYETSGKYEYIRISKKGWNRWNKGGKQ